LGQKSVAGVDHLLDFDTLVSEKNLFLAEDPELQEITCLEELELLGGQADLKSIVGDILEGGLGLHDFFFDDVPGSLGAFVEILHMVGKIRRNGLENIVVHDQFDCRGPNPDILQLAEPEKENSDIVGMLGEIVGTSFEHTRDPLDVKHFSIVG
jgi:hypothetical protein